MQVQKLPAKAGFGWVVDGFRLLRRRPLALLAITFLYLVALVLSTAVPLVGPFAPLLLTPLLAVGVMHAVRTADEGQNPNLNALFLGLRDDEGRAWKRLLILGLLNVVATLLALALASLSDGGTLLRIATGQVEPDEVEPGGTSLLVAALTFLAAYTPLQMGLWFAPLFVAWHGVGPAKAVFFSFFAVLRNKGAFLVYALGWFLVAIVTSLFLQIFNLVSGGSTLLFSLILSPLSLGIFAALYCSFWSSYRGVVLGEGSA